MLNFRILSTPVITGNFTAVWYANMPNQFVQSYGTAGVWRGLL